MSTTMTPTEAVRTHPQVRRAHENLPADTPVSCGRCAAMDDRETALTEEA